MRNKAIFLATTAVALLTGTGAAQAGDLYISVFGGANFMHDSSGAGSGTIFGNTDATANFNMDTDTGFVLGGAIGTHLDKWAKGLRTEVEVSYRRNDIGGRWSSYTSNFDTTGAGPINGNVSNFAIMANVWYDIDMGWKAVPYVGGGVGWARAHLDLFAPITSGGNGRSFSNASTSTNQDASGFAWQLGAGVNYTVAPDVQLGVGYRYFKGPSFDPIFIGKLGVPASVDNENHSVQVNLTIGIN